MNNDDINSGAESEKFKATCNKMFVYAKEAMHTLTFKGSQLHCGSYCVGLRKILTKDDFKLRIFNWGIYMEHLFLEQMTFSCPTTC